MAMRSSPDDGFSRAMRRMNACRSIRSVGVQVSIPPPEHPEPLVMPTDQRRRLHDDDGLAPVEPASEPDQGHSSRLRGATWLDLAFLIQGQLFAQKEVLRLEGRTGAQAQAQKVPRIMRSISSVQMSGTTLRSRFGHRVMAKDPYETHVVVPAYYRCRKTRRPEGDDGIFAEHRGKGNFGEPCSPVSQTPVGDPPFCLGRGQREIIYSTAVTHRAGSASARG